MKNSLFLVIMMFVFTFIQAQNYQISFTGSGESSTVDSVQVTNLTQRTHLTMNGSDILYLQGTVGVNTIIDQDESLHIYPNPMKQNARITFYTALSTQVKIEIFDITGRKIANKNQTVQKGISSFNIANLGYGSYFITISTNEWNQTAKLIATGASVENAQIEYLETVQKQSVNDDLKNNNEDILMQYNEGDRIMFIAYVLNSYARVKTLVPMENMNVDFNFVDCTDGDGDYYPVVTIGTQTWMTESLRTAKYNDGTDIPRVTDNQEWINLTTGAYNYYNNDLSLKLKLGALYNNYAVETGKLCPGGWHVPTDVDYTTLNNYIGNGDWNIGGQLKEQGTIENEDGWWYEPNSEADNRWGLRIRAGGEISTFKDFAQLGYYSYTWTSTENDANTAYYLTVSYNSSYVYLGYVSKNEGLAVRCVQD